MDLLEGLNTEQIEAVTTTEGYVRVVAGAGSGKTKALVYRYAYIVDELGVSPSNILCVTFTNKAANEMKKRIRAMIGDCDTGFICTFHGFCVVILREAAHYINYPSNFIVMDTDDVETILKTVYEANNIKSRIYPFDKARKDILDAKKRGLHIPFLSEAGTAKLKEKYEAVQDIKEKVLLGYLLEQKKCYGLDFEDLITLALYILENHESEREKWQKRLAYVMVDEFQDVSGNQYKLADILSGYHRNLFVVGDPDQTIYSWRGADVNFILNFDKTHCGTKTIILNKNYRSTPNILDASNSLIQKNKARIKKDLIAVKSKSVPTVYYHAKTTTLEADWIARQILEIANSGKSYNEIAVLYRAHFVSRSVEESLRRNQIPYVLYSGIEFYKRKEIKDAISYLRMVVFSDDLSFRRVINEPKRNFGKKRMLMVQEYAESHNCSLYAALKDNLDAKLIRSTAAKEFVDIIEKYAKTYREMRISDVLESVLSESGYEKGLMENCEQERLDNLSELKQSIFELEKTSGEDITLDEYLQNIALLTNADKSDQKKSVKLMTIHTAKGLEFPYVFVCGLNEGTFPNKHVDTPEKLEEERRLAYVAYTRAENALFLSDAEGINYDGSFKYPSRFIFNTDRAYLSYEVELDDELVDDASHFIESSEKSMSKPDKLFTVGDTVIHKVFGKGIILDVRSEVSSYVIQFENYETERNINVRAPLELVPVVLETSSTVDDSKAISSNMSDEKSEVTEENSVGKLPLPSLRVEDNDETEVKAKRHKGLFRFLKKKK